MSKMRMPEMDVVRFQESDVIVASAVPVGAKLQVYNFGDNENYNGGIKYGNTPLFENKQYGGTNILGDAFPGRNPEDLVFFYGDTSKVSLHSMIEDDTPNVGTSVDSGVNGFYTYAGNGVFNRQ